MRRKVVAVTLALAAVIVVGCSKDPQKAKRDFVESGDKFVAQKKYPEAIVQYRNALAIDARAGEVRFKLAGAYEATADVKGALAEYVAASDLMPANTEAHIRAGNYLLAIGQFERAKSHAVAALAQAPTNSRALILLGNSLARLKDLDGAISEVERAVDADPSRTLSYANLGVLQMAKGDRQAAEYSFKRAVDANPKSAAPHLSLANYYWAVDQPRDAERELMAARDLEPRSQEVHRSLAAFYIAMQRYGEAEPHLKTFVEGAPQARLTLADFYLTVGKTKDAVAILEVLAKESDGFIPAKLRLAAIDGAGGRRQEALRTVETILQRDPNNEDALLMKTGLFLEDKKNAEALQIVNRVADSNPRLVRAHMVKGLALEAVGSPDEAVKAYQEALRLSPSLSSAQIRLAKLALARGNPEVAADYAAQAIALQPASGTAHLLLAKAQLLLGKTSLAENELALVGKSNPDLSELHSLFGGVYAAKKDFARARESYERALQLEPGSVNALSGLMGLDLVNKNPQAARARLESRLAAAPNDAALHALAGRTFMNLGDTKRSESAFKRALELDPTNLDAYDRLGGIYVDERRLEEAGRHYEEAIKHAPKPVGALTMLGIILELQHKGDEARKRYEQVLAIDPNAAVAANNLAWSYAESGSNLDVALQLAQTAKAGMPKYPDVDDTLGWVYYKKGLSTLAITSLKQSVAASPKNPQYLYHLGLAYAQGGDKVNARQTLETALKLKADFAGAEEARKVLSSLVG